MTGKNFIGLLCYLACTFNSYSQDNYEKEVCMLLGIENVPESTKYWSVRNDTVNFLKLVDKKTHVNQYLITYSDSILEVSFRLSVLRKRKQKQFVSTSQDVIVYHSLLDYLALKKNHPELFTSLLEQIANEMNGEIIPSSLPRHIDIRTKSEINTFSINLNYEKLESSGIVRFEKYTPSQPFVYASLELRGLYGTNSGKFELTDSYIYDIKNKRITTIIKTSHLISPIIDR